MGLRQRRSWIAASERGASILEDGVSVQRELAEEPRAVGAVEGGPAGVPDALLDCECAPVLESDADGDNREVQELGIFARETVDLRSPGERLEEVHEGLANQSIRLHDDGDEGCVVLKGHLGVFGYARSLR